MSKQGVRKHGDKGSILLSFARSAIAEALGISPDDYTPIEADWLNEDGASFVTLTLNGNLRGCIGSIEARRPLAEDVYDNAVAAALKDPRFPPLSRQEFDKVHIGVSLLSPLRQLDVHSEEEALARLRPGIDGVVFHFGVHKATFLPQVWEQLPDARQFLSHLKIKAGLAANFWHPDVLIYTYSVEKFSEPEESGR